jgi:signal transduction histidine kinase
MRRGLPGLLAACCIACLALAAQASTPVPVEIEPGAMQVAVWPALQVVMPDDINLGPDQAAVLAKSGSAMAVDSPNRIFGRGTSPYWALFSLYNPAAAEKQRLLAVETTTQFDMRLFTRTGTGAWHPLPSLADAAAGRIGGGTTRPAWALDLAPQQATEFLLRIEGPAIVRFPVFVYHPVAFAEQERNITIAIGIALGGCLFIIIYAASLRRYLDDALVLLFIYMIVADLIGALWLSGFLAELFPMLPETALSPIGFAAYASLFGCGSLHARAYLNCAAWSPRADTLLRFLGWLWLALAPFFALAFPVAARILLVWGGAAIASILVVVSALAARRKIRFSPYIGAAWLAYLVGGMVFLAARIVDNPVTWSSSTFVLLQATVVAACFGFAMSQRLMQQRDALVAARQQAVMEQEKAAALMRERSLLFAATNHDLRQPLLGVNLFTDLLKSAATPAEREERSRKLDLALKEVDELLLGIQQLATVHEAEHRPVMQQVKLDDLLAPIIEEYRGRSEYKRITIRYVPSRVSITTHVPYFQRIVRNVLSNAVRYTEQGDRILVGCRRGGGMRLIVADTGHGMTEEQIRRAFDAFQRFDARMSIPDGFGLGLFSTKSLANALGLAVNLKSRAGRGTEFSVALLLSKGP